MERLTLSITIGAVFAIVKMAFFGSSLAAALASFIVVSAFTLATLKYTNWY